MTNSSLFRGMKRIAPIFLLLITLAISVFAQKAAVTKSKITFEIKNLGIKSTGTIGGVQANVQFVPANLAASSIEATADVNTINTDNDERDTHLKSADFFDLAHYPKITMKSISFKKKSGNNYVGQFNVTIRNKTKQLEVPFSYVENGNTATLIGVVKLNRLDFGVGDSSLVLSNDVTVNIEVEVSKS